MKRSLISLLIILIGISNSGFSQISSLKYLIEYNEGTALYDCKIVIIEGAASNYLDRIQFSSQYTIVVPTGSQFEIQELHNPLENNQFYTGTIPCTWEMSNPEIAPPTHPENDYYSVFVTLSPPSAYNDLNRGDTVTLFSVLIDVDPCEDFVRPFISGYDPSSIEIPSGSDLSNGFSIGNEDEIYSGNMFFECHEICSGDCVELTPSLMCSPDEMTYSWSTGESTPTITVCPDENTTYTIEITNPNMKVLNLSTTVNIDNVEVSFDGANEICPGELTEMNPSSGGVWTCSKADVATVTSGGLVMGIAQGNAILTYTNSLTGCISEGLELVVKESPTVGFTGDDRLCIGETSSVSPDTGGTWTSSNPEFATIDPTTGMITAIAQGVINFTFTESTTGCMSTTTALIVDSNPTTTAEFFSICLGTTTKIFPEMGGTWTELNPEIAILDGNEVTGISEGEAGFIYTSEITGCISETLFISISTMPITNLTGPNEICIGEVTTIESDFEGTWSSSDPAVAIIDNSGNITGIGSGKATFTLSGNNGLCISDPSEMVTVIQVPFGTNIDEIAACVGETISLAPNPFIGFWESDNPDVATVDSMTGNITTISEGTAVIKFTDELTGCSSFIDLEVFGIPVVELEGDNELCVGETTTITSTLEGTWYSDNPVIVAIDYFGNVTGLSAGTAYLFFTDLNSGCTSIPQPMTVLPESDPSCIVSTSDVENLSIIMYPNPAKNSLNFEGEIAIESISIYTTSYKKIKDLSFDDLMNTRQISIEDLMSGFYFIEIKSKGRSTYKKLIVE